MRRIALVTFAALALSACSTDSTAPVSTDLLIEAGQFGTALTSIGGYDADVYQDRLANGLPDDLKLTSEQKASIKALVDAFKTATKADRDALGAILRDARKAANDGKTRAEINAILRGGADIRARLAAAEAKLRSDIEAVLTPEQRAWIAAHSPKNCRADKFPPLTDAQKSQIRALEAAFQENNKADLEVMKSIFEEVREAIRAGQSREDITAIIAKGASAAGRLVTARKSLHGQILAVLTPEQRASGCLPLG